MKKPTPKFALSVEMISGTLFITCVSPGALNFLKEASDLFTPIGRGKARETHPENLPVSFVADIMDCYDKNEVLEYLNSYKE